MKVEKSITINRPIETVFNFVTTMESVPLWAPVKSIRAETEGPVHVGATYIQVVDAWGQLLEITTQITDYQPPTSFSFKSISGPLPLESRFSFASLQNNASTRLTLVGEGDPGGSVLKLAGPLLGGLVKKQLDDQLAALKRLLEA